MPQNLTRAFESIESAREYVALLEEAAHEAMAEVEQTQAAATAEADERMMRATNLALYKMSQLQIHLHKSGRILNDLRSIRRLMLGERESAD
jgi:hypothetical protein